MIENVHKTHRGLKYIWAQNKDDLKKTSTNLIGKMKCHYKKINYACSCSFNLSQHAMTSLQINCGISQKKENLRDFVISYMCQILLVSLLDANYKDIDCAHHRITMTTYTQCYQGNVPCSRYYTFDQQISAIFSFHT